MTSSTCLACGESLAFFGKKTRYSYWRCVACGTIQLDPLPTREELSRAYRDDYASAEHIGRDALASRAATRTLHRGLMEALREHGGHGPVLDYGCGWGGLTKMLIEEGFECEGYDLSEEMVRFSKEDGLPVHLGAIEDLSEPNRGAIMLASVYEHLVDHEAWLRAANELLEPGGLLISTQPTAPFAAFAGNLFRLGIKSLPLPTLHQVFCPPWHVALFSIEGLKTQVERCGFRLLEVRPAPQQRQPGLTGMIQATLERVNTVGWALIGVKWPLLTGHIFIFAKRAD